MRSIVQEFYQLQKAGPLSRCDMKNSVEILDRNTQQKHIERVKRAKIKVLYIILRERRKGKFLSQFW